MGVEGQLEFVDALKPDISSYLATTEAEKRPGRIAPWLTLRRHLCYLRPEGEPSLDTPRRLFGAPPQVSRWPRATQSDRERLGKEAAASGSDSGSEGAKGRRDSKRRGSRAKSQRDGQGQVLAPELGEDLLEFTSCFESGNLQCALYDSEERDYVLFLQHDVHSRGHAQWFYYAVRNAVPGRAYRFRIVNMSKPKTLFRMGMRPWSWSEREAEQRAAKGFEDTVWDGAQLWKPVGEDVGYGRTAGSDDTSTLSFSYVFQHGRDCVFFAYYVPYTYSMLRWTLSHVTRDPATGGFCQLKRLATTVGQARCDMLTISNPCVDAKMKKKVVVSARVHPGESNASWLVHGLIGFLLSDTADAQVLRDHFVWILVPMLNPDGVICGNYRCGLCGTDLNRQWKQPHEVLHAPVYKLRKLVARHRSRLAMYLDLHGHARKCGIFSYACAQFEEADHRRWTVRIYPKLLSVLLQEFNFFHCRWSVGKGKRHTGRVVASKDLGITNSYTIEVSMWGAVDGKAAMNQLEDSMTVVPFEPQKLLLFGAGLARALLIQHSLQPLVRGQRLWDGLKGGPWPQLSASKELEMEVRTSSASPCHSESSSESEEKALVEGEEPFAAPLWGQELFNIDLSDLMEGLDELPDADSDSGGSDSCPSEDNLERPKLREVSERLLRSCSEKPLRKASRVKRKAKKEGATGARQRAKSSGRQEPEKDRAEPERPKEILPRAPMLEKVVAFGGTTYLSRRCGPRPEDAKVEIEVKDRDRLSRRGAASVSSVSLAANSRVQLAAACVLRMEESKTRARPKTACAPRARAESEHGPRRPGDLENVALEDLTLSPQSFRMRGAGRPFSFKPPELSSSNDKMAMATLRSWAAAATSLAKANLENEDLGMK